MPAAVSCCLGGQNSFLEVAFCPECVFTGMENVSMTSKIFNSAMTHIPEEHA